MLSEDRRRTSLSASIATIYVVFLFVLVASGIWLPPANVSGVLGKDSY